MLDERIRDHHGNIVYLYQAPVSPNRYEMNNYCSSIKLLYSKMILNMAHLPNQQSKTQQLMKCEEINWNMKSMIVMIFIIITLDY